MERPRLNTEEINLVVAVGRGTAKEMPRDLVLSLTGKGVLVDSALTALGREIFRDATTLKGPPATRREDVRICGLPIERVETLADLIGDETEDDE